MQRVLRLAFALLLVQLSAALKLKLEPYATECVNEVASYEGDRVCVSRPPCASGAPQLTPPPRSTGSFVGSATGAYRYFRNFFDLEIKLEDGTSLFAVRNRQDAKFDFIMPRAGRFTACMRNYGRQPAEVTYSSYIGHKVYHDKLTQDEITPVRDAVFKLRQSLRSVLEEQRYQENRDKALLAVNVSSSKRTVFWAVMESLVLVTVSVGQVYLLKRMFEGQSSKLPRSSYSLPSSARLPKPTWGV